MTVEQIELRKILTQMLADNGINRETIVSFIEKIIDEKVEKAVKKIVHDRDMDYLVEKSVKNNVETAVKEAIEKRVRGILSNTYITITHHPTEKGGEG